MIQPGCEVETIRVKGELFQVRAQLILEGTTNAVGAQKILDRNPERIAAILYAPQSNTAPILVGDPTLRDRGTATNGLDTEPGTGWEIDDTKEAIYAIVSAGGGAQMLKFYEVTGP